MVGCLAERSTALYCTVLQVQSFHGPNQSTGYDTVTTRLLRSCPPIKALSARRVLQPARDFQSRFLSHGKRTSKQNSLAGFKERLSTLLSTIVTGRTVWYLDAQMMLAAESKVFSHSEQKTELQASGRQHSIRCELREAAVKASESLCIRLSHNVDATKSNVTNMLSMNTVLVRIRVGKVPRIVLNAVKHSDCCSNDSKKTYLSNRLKK